MSARSAGISYQELISGDVVPPPKTLTLENPFEEPITSVPVSRYTTREFHELEMQKLWPKVWQFACREEEIPRDGDYLIYDIGHFSIIVVRTPDGIKAHHNVCRHRGRRLCDHDGHAASFICPFHGFSWNVDGSLRSCPSPWDFPHLDEAAFALTRALCETWGGFVFVNIDLDAAPLAEFLGDLPEHFACWSPENRYIQAHVAKIVGCNWKLCQEAFMEALHVIATHPQQLASTVEAVAKLGARIGSAAEITRLQKPGKRRACFRLQLRDGRIVKGRRFQSAAKRESDGRLDTSARRRRAPQQRHIAPSCLSPAPSW